MYFLGFVEVGFGMIMCWIICLEGVCVIIWRFLYGLWGGVFFLLLLNIVVVSRWIDFWLICLIDNLDEGLIWVNVICVCDGIG